MNAEHDFQVLEGLKHYCENAGPRAVTCCQQCVDTWAERAAVIGRVLGFLRTTQGAPQNPAHPKAPLMAGKMYALVIDAGDGRRFCIDYNGSTLDSTMRPDDAARLFAAATAEYLRNQRGDRSVTLSEPHAKLLRKIVTILATPSYDPNEPVADGITIAMVLQHDAQALFLALEAM
jgi:hypothetical protein